MHNTQAPFVKMGTKPFLCCGVRCTAALFAECAEAATILPHDTITKSHAAAGP